MRNDFDLQNEPWTMNKAYLMRLDLRLDERDQASNNGFLLTWYRTLRTVYRNIHWKIIELGGEEKEELLETMFKRAKEFFFQNSSKNPLAKGAQTTNLTVAETLLDEIDTLLNDLIIEYKLIKLDKDKHDPNTDVLTGKFG